MPLFVLASFLFGAVVASFIEVVVARLYTGASITHGRSRCDSCGTHLTVTDLVPILSFVVMKGRCRTCGSRISPSSTISELVLGTCYLLVYASYGPTLATLAFFAALASLLGIVRYDLKHTIIPPVLLSVFLAAALAADWLVSPDFSAFEFSLVIAFLEAISLALIALLSRGRAMGTADVPLVFGLALLAGPNALSGFIFSFWVGAVVGIIILARTPKGSRMGIEVPFAPFLATGFLLALFTQWDPFALISALLARIFGV